MKVEVYAEIVEFLNTYDGTDMDCITELAAKYPDIKENTLYSLKSLNGQRKTTQNLRKVKARLNDIVEDYEDHVNSQQYYIGIIRKLARQHDIQPTSMARLILEHQVAKKDISEIKSTSDLLRDTTLISDKYLAHEIFMAILSDSTYGPMSDLIKNLIGKEYEVHLEELVEENGLAYKTETDLRVLGYDRTPDILLEIPISVDGFVVNWIESKALFADEKNHRQYITDQYESYFNRFGSGLVIYWFGFIDSLIQKNEKIIVKDNFPAADIIKMDPECQSSYGTSLLVH